MNDHCARRVDVRDGTVIKPQLGPVWDLATLVDADAGGVEYGGGAA